MTDKKYTYFVSYVRGGLHGNTKVTTIEPISSIGHIRSIEDDIDRRLEKEGSVVTNYILMNSQNQ